MPEEPHPNATGHILVVCWIASHAARENIQPETTSSLHPVIGREGGKSAGVKPRGREKHTEGETSNTELQRSQEPHQKHLLTKREAIHKTKQVSGCVRSETSRSTVQNKADCRGSKNIQPKQSSLRDDEMFAPPQKKKQPPSVQADLESYSHGSPKQLMLYFLLTSSCGNMC